MHNPKPVTDPQEEEYDPPTDPGQPEVSDDQLDHALEETFPASDPISP